MKKIFSIILLFIILLTFISCGNNSEDVRLPNGFENFDSKSESLLISDRKHVYTLDMSVETKNYESYMESLENKIAEYQGYCSSYTEGGVDGEPHAMPILL